MKYVILLAIFAFVACEHGNHDHVVGSLEHLVHEEVREIMEMDGMSVHDCIDECDSRFDLAAGHDEELTDKLCRVECEHHATHGHPGGPN